MADPTPPAADRPRMTPASLAGLLARHQAVSTRLRFLLADRAIARIQRQLPGANAALAEAWARHLSAKIQGLRVERRLVLREIDRTDMELDT